MRFQDILWFSVGNLIHRGLRSWLTILGIVVGIAAVVAIVGLGAGLEASMTQQIAAFSSDEITISPGYSRASQRFGPRIQGSDSSATSATSEDNSLTIKDEMALRYIQGVEKVMGLVSQNGQVEYVNEEARISIEGVEPNEWKDFGDHSVESGRLLTSGDTFMALVGSNIATEIFSDPITTNRQIIIENKIFNVVGVLAPAVDSSTDSRIIIPLDAAREIFEDIDKDEYTSIRIKANEDQDLELMEETITEILLLTRGKIPDQQDFSVRSNAAMQSRFSDMMGTMITTLTGIAAVSLLVGAIGIANTMYMSVIERTRQIGILKALGATNGTVMILFLVESGLVGLMGGTFGVLMGIMVSGIMTGSGFSLLPGRLGGGSAAIISPDLIIFALVFSIVVGIISGIFPARMAAKLEPVEALRYE